LPKGSKLPISEELPSLSRVFGYMAVKELDRLEDKVKLLARLGYPNKEIAIIVGSTPDSVATLKALKPKSKGKATKGKAKRS
jgi:hypothetical protein